MTSSASTPVLATAFYPEYFPSDELSLTTHLDLMVEAGITSIRVGESVWSTWETADGVFNTKWMQEVLDEALTRGITVILGTPTYAIPPWLQREHPEIAVVKADGSPVPWGSRQEVDYSSPTFRFYAERVIRKILGEFATHPAVIGLQLDNEPGLHVMHNDSVFEQFVASLKEEYGTVDRLNDEWGLTYWSHRITEWEDLWRPQGNSVPAYNLAWRRFQTEITKDFITWQMQIAREYITGEQFLTTCIAYSRPAVDAMELGKSLDVVAANCYFDFQHGLADSPTQEVRRSTWYTSRPAGLIQQLDRVWSTKRAPFLITETGAGTIADSHENYPAFDGQIQMAAWAMVARGASQVGYWHWMNLHKGYEMYWGGILGHDAQPGRTYNEIASIGKNFAIAGDDIAGLVPQAKVGVIFSLDSKWAMEFHPPLQLDGSSQPDRRSYENILANFTDALFAAKVECGFLTPSELTTGEQLLAQYSALVVPGMIVMSDEAAQALTEYVQAGGHLIIGPRTGYSDAHANARVAPGPGPLSELAGVKYRQFSNVDSTVPVSIDGIATPFQAQNWIEYFEPTSAQVIARYIHDDFSQWPAATLNHVGKGTVLSIGSLLERSALRELLTTHLPADAQTPFDLPSAVTAYSATNSQNETLWFFHNWSAEPEHITLPHGLIDVLNPDRPTLDQLSLPRWGIAVLKTPTT